MLSTKSCLHQRKSFRRTSCISPLLEKKGEVIFISFYLARSYTSLWVKLQLKNIFTDMLFSSNTACAFCLHDNTICCNNLLKIFNISMSLYVINKCVAPTVSVYVIDMLYCSYYFSISLCNCHAVWLLLGLCLYNWYALLFPLSLCLSMKLTCCVAPTISLSLHEICLYNWHPVLLLLFVWCHHFLVCFLVTFIALLGHLILHVVIFLYSALLMTSSDIGNIDLVWVYCWIVVMYYIY